MEAELIEAVKYVGEAINILTAVIISLFCIHMITK